MRITMLGCGSSAGVPLVGCDCSVCTSNNPKNKRTRVSLYIETGHLNLLIDTSPDLRQQLLRQNIRKIDAVLYTHEHADHTHGIDDLRCVNYLNGKELPIYGNDTTIRALKEKFAYAFLPKPQNVWFRPCLVPQALPDAPVHEFSIAGVSITMFEQQHGKIKSCGYRIGNFAYSTDVDILPETAFEVLAGTEIWVVDCLRYTESHSHSNLARTLEWVDRIKPRLAVLTHMAHEFEYEKLASELPKGIIPGHDGLILEL